MSDKKVYVKSCETFECLDLEVSTYHLLRRAGLNTFGDLFKAIKAETIREIRGIGEKRQNEIFEKIRGFQLTDKEIINQRNKQNSEKKFLGDREKYVSRKLSVSEYNSDYIEIISTYQRTIEEIFHIQQESIHRQLRFDLLHPKAKIHENTLISYLNFNPENMIEFSKIFTKIIGDISITYELDVLLHMLDNRDISILIMRYGFAKATYQEIGEKHNVTRERVRQILERIKRKVCQVVNNILNNDIGSQNTYLIRMQSALLYAKDLGEDLSYAGWSNHLLTSGLLGNVKINSVNEIDFIELFLAVCNLFAQQNLALFKLPENLKIGIELNINNKPNVTVKKKLTAKSTPKEVKKQIIRHVYFTSAVNSRWLSHEINCSIEQTCDILTSLGFDQIEGDWFVSKNIKTKNTLSNRDTLDHTLRKMSLFCGPMNIQDLCSGIRHAVSRTCYSVPPPNVMKFILEKSGYVSEEDLWYWPGDVDEELNQGEQVIFECLSEKGAVLHHSELAQAFIDSELSFPSLHATLNRSPLFDRFDYALYKLRGAHVSYEDIERANNEGDRVPVNLEIVPQKTGVIKIVGSLGILAIGTGVFYSDNLPNLSGQWECVVDGKDFNKIRVTTNEIKDLLEPMEFLSCEVGDRISLSFNTWNRTVSIERLVTGEN